MNKTYISKLGLVRAVMVGIAVAFAGTSLFAQEPSPAAESPAAIGAVPPAGVPAPDTAGATAETERIIVTGSNIPTAQEVGPNPVLSINRDLINKSGQRSTEELLRALPVSNAQGVGPSNNATGFTAGASTIALRGFDPRATLILLDGRRVAQYPVGIVGIGFVDLNSIPESAIESIEILKDGASTTYGADAIAGVVNIKLRKEYHGAEASIEYGNSLDKDSGEFKASLIFGAGDGNTNVTGVMNYYHRNSIFARDRGYSQKPPFLSSNASPGNFELSRDAVIEAGGTPVGALDSFFGSPPNFTDGLTPASGYRYAGGRISTFNFSATAGALPDSERYGGYINFNHKIFGDQLVAYGDLQYQNVKTHNELAPSPTGDFNTAGSPIIAIPPREPNPAGTTPFGGPTYEETGVAPGAFNPFNPFNQIISGGSRYRLAEFGNRLFDNETDAFLTTVGVKGDKLFDGSWGYDSAFRYSQIKNTGFSQTVSASRLNRILNAADPIFDPTSPQFIGTTVPYNPFGDFRNPPPTNATAVEFATVHATDTDISKIATLDLNVYTTQLFKLPAGGIGFAIGGQFRRENIDQIPDELNIVGDTVGGSPTSITHGGRKSYGIYVEASIPIFSPAFSSPGFYSLELTAAGRFEEFLNNDTNVAVPKFGLRWQPFDESLTLRATWGKGFREPSLYELYANPTASLAGVTDPQTGITNPETPTLTVSNPNLAPEDSNAFTAGIVYTPKFVPGLTLTVDLYDIERTGVVNVPFFNSVLMREANGTLLPGEVVERTATGQISRIIVSNQNSGAEISRGLDFGIQYQLQTRYGTFTSLTQATYLDAFLFQPTADVPVANLRGRVFGEFATIADAFLKWKGRSIIDWSWNGFDLNFTANYLDGYHEHKPNALVHWVSQTWLFDTQASYDFTFTAPVETAAVPGYSKDVREVERGKDSRPMESAASQTASYGLPIWKRLLNGTTITLGCNNVFGTDPPTAYNFGQNSSKFPQFIYDPTGRFVYVQLTKKF